MVQSRIFLIAAIIFCMIFMSSTSAMAIESLTLGLKYWYPEWELDGYSDFDVLEWETSYGMVGPTVSVLFSERWAMSLSFITGEFEKDFPMGSVNYYGYTSAMDWSSKRNDFDLIFAFIFNPYFNLFAGLKYLTYDQTIDGLWAGSAGRWQLKYDLEAAGLGFGAGFNVPIGTSFGLYSTLSLSALGGTFEISGTHTAGMDGDVVYPIFSIEAGARYNMQRVPLIFMGSFRYQQSTIDIDWGENAAMFDSLDEKFYGLVFFIGYRFSS